MKYNVFLAEISEDCFYFYKPGVEPKKYPTSELIRRKNAGEPLEDDEDKDALPRGKSTWQGTV